MSTVFLVAALFAIAGVVLSLFAGVFLMGRGGNGKSQIFEHIDARARRIAVGCDHTAYPRGPDARCVTLRRGAEFRWLR